MSDFIKTDTILDKILTYKVEEVAARKLALPLNTLREQAESRPQALDFVQALRKDTVALIAEVKKASPSKGVFIKDFDPLALAATYADNGASAISVLTDEKFFQGHLDYLASINQHVTVPTLRKDFIIDAYQVYEGRVVGASAILLIVAALSDSQLTDLYAQITELGMAALVEVHNEAELERAMKIEPALLGINNRDLKTFTVDLHTTERIASQVPDSVTLVAESGMKSAEDVARMGQMGAHAVLIGEGLVTSGDIGQAVKIFSGQKRG